MFTSPRCLDHKPGAAHPEAPERLSAVLRAVRTEDPTALREPEPASREALERVHPARYLDQLATLASSGGGMLDRSQEAAYFVQLVTALRGADGYQGQPLLIASQAFDPDDARRLHEAGQGTVQMSYPMEVWDEQLFPVVCPGKARHVGRNRWLDNMCQAVEIFGRGNVGSNLVAGVETAAPDRFSDEEQALLSTLEGFAWLARHDIRPAFSPWTVAPGSAWEDKQPPGTHYYLTLGWELYNLHKRYGLTYDVGLNAGCYKCGVYTIPRDFPRLLDGLE